MHICIYVTLLFYPSFAFESRIVAYAKPCAKSRGILCIYLRICLLSCAVQPFETSWVLAACCFHCCCGCCCRCSPADLWLLWGCSCSLWLLLWLP